MSPQSTAESGEVRDVRLIEALSERYLSYALSTIMSRSLPDVRDGLKPVHRRLLFAMRELRLNPDTPFKKSARVVGDVIGKYHPHGDQAIYDALVRLAQDFALRYPLIDGQGNFGNVDGDNAAAMRYTEARLTAVAARLLDGIDEDAVDFRPTYDGEAEEPTVLPANFPNLLANGAQGIAVGMATSVPPHNVAELAEALIHLVKHPNAAIETLVDRVQGPDFPTGGLLVEPRESIVEAYRTGRGSFRLRARFAEPESLPGGRYQLVVTEIPYQVGKAKLIERVAELLEQKKLPLLADIRDESAEDIRLVFEPKSRNVDPEHLKESLYRATDLEVRVPLNLNVLDGDQTPRVLSLREALQAYIDHRHVVLRRRTSHRLEKIAKRLDMLAGYLVAYLNLDEVIRIIREEDEPKAELMRTFELTDTQAEAILNMRLRALRRLEEMEIRKEHAALTEEQADLSDLLSDEARRMKVLEYEFRELKKEFAPDTALGRRRTDVADPPAAVVVPLEAVIEREPVTVLLSAKGWIRAMKGHGTAAADAKYKEGDKPRFAVACQTTDKLLVFATNGRMYTLGADKLPGGRGFGEPLRLMIDLPNDQDVIALMVHQRGRKLLVASSDGRGFVTPEDELVAQTKNGKQVLNLAEGAEAQLVRPVPAEADHVAVIGDNRKIVAFPLAELPEMTRGRGVTLQKYRDGGLKDAKPFVLEAGLEVQLGPERARVFDVRDWVAKRAAAGRLPPQGFPKHGRFD